MRRLEQAKQRAYECRTMVGLDQDGLLERLKDFLWDQHRVEPHPAPPASLQGSQAELRPSVILYDVRLDSQPAQLLITLAHELGHLELHSHRFRSSSELDPILGSVYMNDGAPGIARYSKRLKEESEAIAFAVEFVCPRDKAYKKWLGSSVATSIIIADELGLPVELVRLQLAEALYEMANPASIQERSPALHSSKYDQRQIDAAKYIGSPALINAGPGTGKTATLLYRIDYLLKEMEADPSTILVLTFSTDATEEIRARIESKFGNDVAQRVEATTFHGFGTNFIIQHGHLLGIPPNFTIIDDLGQHELINSLLGEANCEPILELSNLDNTIAKTLRHINHLKDRHSSLDDIEYLISSSTQDSEDASIREQRPAFLKLFRAYEIKKSTRGLVDFADLINFPVQLMAGSSSLKEAYREKYKWVIVDEYQDVSRSVASMLKLLCGESNPPWVVGDKRQAIYGFRGAAPENIDLFETDFSGVKFFNLTKNYRSAQSIVTVANQMASVMEDPSTEGPDFDTSWEADSDLPELSSQEVLVAEASSDTSEYEGIARQVHEWVESGVSPGDIAVLARRNIDVRNIALELGKRGISSLVSGLATPEGAAGDLASIITYPDRPRPSLPRIALAIGRNIYTTSRMSDAIRIMLSGNKHEASPDVDEETNKLIREIQDTCAIIDKAGQYADSFAILTAFLFDTGTYLRRILNMHDIISRNLALSEITTALSRSAAFRFTHPGISPSTSRISFAHYFRSLLCSATPAFVPPLPSSEAVRVMTCHASKGLEFPYVIVTGQSRLDIEDGLDWLPPALKRSIEDKSAEANALLFVGATRSKRCLLITYATSKSGQGGKARKLVPLLDIWKSRFSIRTVQWNGGSASQTNASVGMVWGGKVPGSLRDRSLRKEGRNNCTIRIYLEKFLDLYFPIDPSPLYPIFVDVLRRVLQKIIGVANSKCGKVDLALAEDTYNELWPQGDFATHPHNSIYEPLGRKYILAFASIYEPHGLVQEEFDLDIPGTNLGSIISVRLNALGGYRRSDDSAVAITLTLKSLKKDLRGSELNWSSLDEPQQVPLLILRKSGLDIQPKVFSAADGAIYDVLWNRRKANMDSEVERIIGLLDNISNGHFDTIIVEDTCNKCPSRVICPHWYAVASPVALAH